MKFSEYGKALDNSDVLSEGQKAVLKNRLMEAKVKMKELKKAQAEKAKEKKVDEGILSGGERACTECGGTGMVYEEPKAVPDHVKGKVAKYNTMMKATKAAHKRMDANHNGIPDAEEVDEDSTDTKTTTKTQHGTATATFGADGKRKGVVHKDEREYSDGGDDIATNARSGKGTKSHAKSQSAAEKKDKAPAQKQSPKSAKTWGMKDSEKFDNRDGAPAKPKKEKEEKTDETYGQGVYEAKKKKDVKEAAAMWNSVKQTAAYMAEKKAIEKKDKPMKGSKVADEGNAVTGGLADKNIAIGSKIPGTDVIKKKQIETESSDFTRMQEQLARLNRSETKTAINENSEVSRLRALTNLFKG
jgi:hypothetical protein